MANEDKKDFNAMLHRATDMPRIQLVTDAATVQKYGTGGRDTRRGAPDVHPRGGQGVPQGLAEKQPGLVYAPVALPCEKALSLLRRKAAHGKSAWNIPRASDR